MCVNAFCLEAVTSWTHTLKHIHILWSFLTCTWVRALNLVLTPSLTFLHVLTLSFPFPPTLYVHISIARSLAYSCSRVLIRAVVPDKTDNNLTVIRTRERNTHNLIARNPFPWGVLLFGMLGECPLSPTSSNRTMPKGRTPPPPGGEGFLQLH